MGDYIEEQLTLQINRICYKLEHLNYLSKIKRERLKKELDKLLKQRHTLRKHMAKKREE